MAKYTITLCTNIEILSEGYDLGEVGRANSCLAAIEAATDRFLSGQHVIESYMNDEDELALETSGNFRDWKGGKFYRSCRGENEDGDYFRHRTCYVGIVHVIAEAMEHSILVTHLAQEMVQVISDTLSEAEKETQDDIRPN